MIHTICIIHKWAYSLNAKHRYKYHNIIMWFIINCIVRVCNIGLYLYLNLIYPFIIKRNILSKNNNIAVCLTTFPGRINTVWMTIDSLSRQTIQPEFIMLYLSKMDFPNGEISLPKKLLSYKKCGLDIKFVDDNIKPHKKYLYAMKEHPEWTIITVDDDIYYRNDLIQELLNLHKLYPYAVCANTVHKIKIDKKKRSFCPYLTWNDAILESPMLSFENIAVGCNGVLYPANVFEKSKTALDIELIKRTSINADDLWLKAQEVLLRIPVCANKYYSTSLTVFKTKKTALMNTNTGIKGLNDIQWNKLVNEFDLYKQYYTLIS